jgi:hypothetical protein
MLQIIIASVIFVGIAFAAIAIKMFLVKGSTFEKQCSCGNKENGSCSSSCKDVKTEQ